MGRIEILQPHGYSAASFPLTPALSLGEREKLSSAADNLTLR